MRKSLIAALAVVVVAGAAVAAVPLIERHAAQRIKADMEGDGTTKAGSVEVGLFDRKIVVKDMQVTSAGNVSIGRWEASGLAWPLSELLEGRTPFSGLKLGDPFQAGHVELRDLKIADTKGRWSIDSVAIDNLSLDRYEPAVGPGQFTALAMRIAKAASVGRLEEKQASFTDPVNGATVKIAGLAMTGLDKGKVGSFELTGLDVVPKGAGATTFSMADAKLAGLDLRRPLVALSAPGWRPGTPIGRIDLESASLTGFSGDALTKNGVSLGSVTQQTTHEAGDVKRSRVRVEGFVLAPPAGNAEALQARMVLQSMGLKDLRLALDCGGTEDRAKGEMSIDRCALNGPELGELTLSFRLVNADAPFWSAIDDGNTIAMLTSKIGLSNAKVVLADRGVVDRTLKAIATTSGQLTVSVRNNIAQQVRRYQPPGILITDDLSKLLDTVARFIENGGTLALDAKPDAPIGIDKIGSFTRPGSDLVTLLGLSATLSR